MFITRVGLTGKSQQGYKLLKFFRVQFMISVHTNKRYNREYRIYTNFNHWFSIQPFNQ